MSSGSKSGVLYATFNQDCTCVALGSQQGVHIYNVDTHKLCYRHAIGAVSIVEMLFCTSLVGFVGAGEQPALTPRKLTLLNTTATRTIQDFTYPTSVLAVRMNRQRLVVVTSRRVHVYSMQDLSCLRVMDTDESPRGCCALTCCHEPNLLALPSSPSTGTVRIYDLAQEGGNVLSEVQAHQTPVVTLAWNADGTLLATASAKGTVVRVHRMPRAGRGASFRRGSTSATIQSLSFSPPGLPWQLLLAASSHGTVHVFRLEEAEPQGALPRPASAAVGLLSAVMDPARNIATIRLPRSVGTAICCFRPNPSSPAAAAAAADAAAGEGDAAAAAAAAAAGGAPGGVGRGPEALRAFIMVATYEGLLYEYSLTDLTNPQARG
ncbi:Autophagy-related protein 18, partial [Tetrabaena socialis]